MVIGGRVLTSETLETPASLWPSVADGRDSEEGGLMKEERFRTVDLRDRT